MDKDFIIVHGFLAFLILGVGGVCMVSIGVDRYNKSKAQEQKNAEQYAKVDDEVNLGKLISLEMVTGDTGGRYRSQVIVKYRVVAEKGTVLDPTWCSSYAPTPCDVLYSPSINRITFVPK